MVHLVCGRGRVVRMNVGALAIAALSCGAPSKPIAGGTAPTSVAAFLDVLRHGRSLYGVGAGCEEWVARRLPPEPASQDVAAPGADTDDDVADAEVARLDAEEAQRDRVLLTGAVVGGAQDDWLLSGVLNSLRADAAGLLYGFSYTVVARGGVMRMRIVGRGSSHPAPGVQIAGSTPGTYLIGTGTYCVDEVDVRAHPTDPQAILIGRDRWFLMRDACLASSTASLSRVKGCSTARDGEAGQARPDASAPGG